ncbi:helix-turn-helix domain-containing protein [Streptomyces sp. NPDC014779]|uniref:helix-turn-helix domain-containing protein n=1 Tax=Streptomyces sp. NPDC014779 TaxID=3364911 RepID=UPI0036F787A7
MTSTQTPAAGMTRLPAAGTNRYIPPHGTQYRYRGERNGAWPGCRCDKCTAAHNRACKARRLGSYRGTPARHPGEPVLAHIKTLHEAGMSYDLIARRAGVSHNTIQALVRGVTKTCRRSRALKILAVQPGDFDEVAEIPSAGTRRRVQAMYAMGHSPKVIAVESGMSTSFVSHLANGGPRKVDAPSAAAIHEAYRSLAAVPGASNAARRRAAKMGWRDPLWWEDMGHIDDPAFDPATAEQLNFHERAALRAEEILHLASYGTTEEEIARRLGLGKDYVVARLRELREVAA